MSPLSRTLALMAVLLAALPQAARADAIDGDWCNASKHLSIRGPSIVTPGGNSITGEYHRHGFTYIVPANENGAGTKVVVELLNEENARVTQGAGGSSEIWERCKPTS